MANPSQVDAALVAKLLGDAQLMAIATDGVYFGDAPQGATSFIALKLHGGTTELTEGGSAFETFTYSVIAWKRSTSGADLVTAENRLDTLLHHGTLTVTGWTFMEMHRVDRVRDQITDADNKDVRWQYRGGIFEVTVQPN